MAEPGLFLSSFVEQFQRGRAQEEASRRAAAQEARDVFGVQQYVEDLDREREAERTLAEVLRRRQAAGAGPLAVSPAGAGAPTIPMRSTGAGAFEADLQTDLGSTGPALSVAAGAPAALAQMAPARPAGPVTLPGAGPERPPVLDQILGGLSPEAGARFMTSRVGRQALPTLEESEREQRQKEDRREAEGFFQKAQEAFTREIPDIGGGYSALAAAFRRLSPERAAHYMEVGAKFLTDRKEREEAPKEIQAINAAVKAWQADPTPANLATVQETMAGVKTVTGRDFALEVTKNAVKTALSKDPEESAFLIHTALRTTRDGIPLEQAWDEAMQKYPGALAKFWERAMFSPDKTVLPDFVYEKLKTQPPHPSKDLALPQRAWVAAMDEARQKGIQRGTPAFSRLLNETINRFKREEKEATQTEDERALAKLRKESLELTVEAKRNPDKLSLDAVTRNLQRLERAIDAGGLDAETERQFREAHQVLTGVMARHARELKETTGGGGPPNPQDKRAQPPGPGPTKEQAKAELRRLLDAGHTLKTAEAAMRAQGWR